MAVTPSYIVLPPQWENPSILLAFPSRYAQSQKHSDLSCLGDLEVSQLVLLLPPG